MEFPDLNNLTSEVGFDTIEETSEYSEPGEYPCLIVEGLSTEQELNFFSNYCENSPDALPLYTFVGEMYIPVGYLELTLKTVLAVQSIYPYKFELAKSAEDRRSLDFTDSTFLEKLIRASLNVGDDVTLLQSELQSFGL